MSDSIIDQLERMKRSYIRTFGRMPESLDISEAVDQKLCDELEKYQQWTPWIPGAKLRTMHGGKIFALPVRVVPAIDFSFGWEKPDA